MLGSSVKGCSMRVGFLGYGEAGYVISKALLGNGLGQVVAYDCNYCHPALAETIQRRAADAGVQLVEAYADLAEATDIILSVVTAASALEAAEETATHMRQDQTFCDCNSVSPSTKIRIAHAIERSSAIFVEAAIMAPVQADLSRVPILMNGHGAPKLAGYLERFGMKV